MSTVARRAVPPTKRDVLHIADTCVRRFRRLATVEGGVALESEKEGRDPGDVGGGRTWRPIEERVAGGRCTGKQGLAGKATVAVSHTKLNGRRQQQQKGQECGQQKSWRSGWRVHGAGRFRIGVDELFGAAGKESGSQVALRIGGHIVERHLESTDFVDAKDAHETRRELVGRCDESANRRNRGGERHGSEVVKDRRTGEVVHADVVGAVSVRGEGGQNG
jgi:hypothetical protein